MKKLLLTLCLAVIALAASAYDFAVNGIYYNIINSQTYIDGTKYLIAEVTYKDTNYNSYSGKVSIPTFVTSGDQKYVVMYIGEKAFYNCTNLTSVQYSSIYLYYIKDYAFYGCKNLTSLFSLSHTISVGDYAFYGCSSMTEFDSSSQLKSIGSLAFAYCSSLKSFTLGSKLATCGTNILKSSGAEDSKLILNCTCTVSTFADSNFDYVEFGTDCTVIPKLPTHLKKLTMNSQTIASATYSSESIIEQAGSKKLSTVVPDASYLLIDTLVIGPDVTQIGARAFSYPVHADNSPTVLLIEGKVSFIGSNAFAASPIMNLPLPESLTQMNQFVCVECRRLTTVTIPSSYTFTLSYVFSGCTNLQTVFDKTSPGYGASAFSPDNELLQVFVLTKSAYTNYVNQGYKRVYLVGDVKTTPDEDVNNDGAVDTQDVLKVYDYMKKK